MTIVSWLFSCLIFLHLHSLPAFKWLPQQCFQISYEVMKLFLFLQNSNISFCCTTYPRLFISQMSVFLTVYYNHITHVKMKDFCIWTPIFLYTSINMTVCVLRQDVASRVFIRGILHLFNNYPEHLQCATYYESSTSHLFLQQKKFSCSQQEMRLSRIMKAYSLIFVITELIYDVASKVVFLKDFGQHHRFSQG